MLFWLQKISFASCCQVALGLNVYFSTFKLKQEKKKKGKRVQEEIREIRGVRGSMELTRPGAEDGSNSNNENVPHLLSLPDPGLR